MFSECDYSKYYEKKSCVEKKVSIRQLCSSQVRREYKIQTEIQKSVLVVIIIINVFHFVLQDEKINNEKTMKMHSVNDLQPDTNSPKDWQVSL